MDECHRGSADEDSAWHEVLDYFTNATHLGLTATPTETKDVSNFTYFNDPIFTYSLKQGIEDGFLAPYKVIRIVTDVDALGYTPEPGKLDKHGQLVEQRAYNTKDYDRNLVLEKRTWLVAARVWEYLSGTDPMAKTIVFCDDQDHAERMRQELVKLIPAAASNRRYVMRITGDDKDGKAQLGNFIDNDEPFPVIVTTSRLLSTGVDAKTCKLIVLDQNINSITQFKQIIGRGTRLREDYQKLFFTIMDFKGATRLFADPKFDGEPVVIYEPTPDEPVIPPEGGTENRPDVLHDGPGGNGPLPPPPGQPSPRVKYVVADVDVRTAIERSQDLDEHGKLITEDYRVLLRGDIKRTIQARYASLKDFLNHWIEAGRKQAVLDELKDAGISLEALQQVVPHADGLDAFDLVTHIAFDQKPLTRKERADQVRNRNYFAKYGDQARAVLEALLEKYADHGITDIEDPNVLELPPFSELGTKTQIRRGIFGGNERFSEALTEMERALYEETA